MKSDLLFNEKIRIGAIKLPPRNYNPKAYYRLYRIIKLRNYIKLLEEQNKDLFEYLIDYNKLCTPEFLKYEILKKQFNVYLKALKEYKFF